MVFDSKQTEVKEEKNSVQHKNYGKVPSYINKYKEQREEALK